MPETIKVDGAVFKVVNAYSCGPGCVPHTYVLRGMCGVFEVRNTAKGWIRNEGRGGWIPALSIWATFCTVEVG